MKGTTCYLFAGRNDDAACNMLFTFSTKSHRWSRPRVSGDIPGERDGHSAAIIGNDILYDLTQFDKIIIGNYMYVFGGYEENFERFGQDVYRLDLDTFTWKYMVELNYFF